MRFDADALVVGAGPAGTCAATLLAKAGWRVILVEQHVFPRRKVCGECVAAGNLVLLDALGVGAWFRAAAGAELRRTAWMGAAATVVGDMPRCLAGPDPYGRALGRDQLDTVLVARARALGVDVRQPARVRLIKGDLGDFECTIEEAVGGRTVFTVPVVVDAHGSWERGPESSAGHPERRPPRRSDLFAFKANFRNTTLLPGLLPVLALPGGYGGMVVGESARTTVACCLRRDALAACRARAPGASAGEAVEAFLRDACAGVDTVLRPATREDGWLSVGPLRPGIRLGARSGAFRVGNAAGESHALIGEGITMALQSSALLTRLLTRQPVAHIRGLQGTELHRDYAAAWRRRFARRLRLAAVFAHIAMRPALAEATRLVLQRRPNLLRSAAHLAGKAANADLGQPTTTEMA